VHMYYMMGFAGLNPSYTKLTKLPTYLQPET
jgi:hypothetical protein